MTTSSTTTSSTSTSNWQPGGPVLTDFDVAYDNPGAIAESATWPQRWRERADAFRAQMQEEGRLEADVPYDVGPRHRYDLFKPKGEALGTIVFVHGGFWRAFDKSVWSHFASELVAAGYRVAMPSYTLCPQARVAEITREIGGFVDHLAQAYEGPLSLVGHSVGGQLVTRLLCVGAPISDATAMRIGRVLSISGVHDLLPLIVTKMNAVLHLDGPEAASESPALLTPRAGVDLLCCVGGDELPEFRRQNALIANIWHGFGARTQAIEIAGTHHFSVLEALLDRESAPFHWLTQNDQPTTPGEPT